jgi:DnaK suppressor protein
MALTPEQTTSWRTKLLELRASLERELGSAKEAARPVDLNQPIGRLTRMDAMQEQQMAMARLDRMRNRMQAIASALGRLDSGSYGECVKCEEDIEPRRLEARPETFLCLSCQKSRD